MKIYINFKYLIPITFAVLFFSCSSDDSVTKPKIQQDDEKEISNKTVIIENDFEKTTVLENIVEDPLVADYLVKKIINIEELLTIKPGVVIAFEANAGFDVEGIIDNGALIAKGTKEQPIAFTGVNKTKGYWRGIRIFTNDVRNELDYAIIEYAGSDIIVDDVRTIDGRGAKAALGLNYEPTNFISSVKLSNSIIRNNNGYGFAAESNTLIRGFKNNSFTNNEKAAVLVYANSVDKLDAESKYKGNNGYDGVEVIGGDSTTHRLKNDAIWKSFNDGSSYLISSSLDINAKLTIMPGVTLEFGANKGFEFKESLSGPEGIIVAKGTTNKPITFTGFKKEKGYWKGLRIRSSSTQNILENAIVEYAGSDKIAGDFFANIGLDKAGAFDAPKLTVNNCNIRKSTGCGIAVDNTESFLQLNNNAFSELQDANVCRNL